MTRASLAVVLTVAMSGCSTGPEITRVQARPGSPAVDVQPGEHPLGLNPRRDGTLYIPKRAGPRTPVPLLVLLHGGGQRKELFRFTFPLAEELGVVILTLDSRDNTWDGIDSPFGPDVVFIDAALRHAFERVAVDPRRLALGGFSDGASYALSLGLANGDLFTHLAAFAPGFIARPAPPAGRPQIFIAHGTRDNVLGIDQTSRRLVPQLRGAGYDVTYREFDGPHNTPPPIARAALEWLIR
jgi:phospholipase/carboxylesterase